MKNITDRVPFEIVNKNDYIWRTPHKINSIKNASNVCYKCKTKLVPGFALIPVGKINCAKVPGLECKKCRVLYISNPKPVKTVLIDNEYAKNILLNGKALHNFSIDIKLNNELQEKSSMLKKVESSVFIASLNNKLDVIITKSKTVRSDDLNCHNGKQINVVHYSEPFALKLLTGLYRKERNRSFIFNGIEYKIGAVYPKKYSESFPDSIMPSCIKIKPGGGYRHYIQNSFSEIVDLLLFSPGTQQYEIIKATFDKNTNECYVDIGIFRSFLSNFGNPKIKLSIPKSSIIKYRKGWTKDDLRDESMLHAYGYNVSQSNNMSESERQTLLFEIIDSGILSRSRVIYLLDFFIKMHSTDKDYIARNKWAIDKHAVINYKVNPNRFLIART